MVNMAFQAAPITGLGQSFRKRLQGSVATFVRGQDGNMTVLGLVMGALMLAFGGLAVDMMRYEATRAELQNTLDRSTLAAAAWTQQLDPEAVVIDYFDKAGLSEQLVSVEATQGLNFRRVDAEADADTLPFFLNMVGIENLYVNADSAAEQRISNVEVMMVLDVSGSMNSNNKLTTLKSAGREFINTVLSTDVDDKISIGIVPFNGQVNLGVDLLGEFNATHPNGEADVNCVDLPASVYTTTGISPSLALPMTADADSYSTTTITTSWSTANSTPTDANKWCPPQPTNIVRLPGQDIATLQGYISGLVGIGATSINAGMKFGLALLDPDIRPAYAQFITAGKMPTTLATRPYEYDDDQAMKVIVLMTDGEHFAEERINNGYKTGTAPFWRSNADGLWTVFHPSRVTSTNATTICNSRPFWVPGRSAWYSRPWNGTAPSTSACYSPTATYTGIAAKTWQQVWQAFRVSYVAQQYYVRASLGNNYNYYMDMFRSKTATTTMDTQLQTICAMAKDNDVIIYGIAFNAPTNAQIQIQGCATSMAYYYEADSNAQLTTAFRTIANNISQLRLIQ